MTHDADIDIRDFMIPSDTPDITLHIRNKRLRYHHDFGEARTVLLMHGATYGSGSLFDTPLEGYTFMDYLARRHFDVYAVDVRGYGHSSRPPQMDFPPMQSAPLGQTESGIRDFTSALNFVLRTSAISRLNIIGMSWGGTVTGAFTVRHPHKVRKLGLIAPQWISNLPIPLDAGGALGGYRVVHAADAEARWIGAAPQGKRETLIPEGGFQAWLANTVQSEPDAVARAAQSIRAANGPIQDIRDFWAKGRPFYDPGLIEVPVMLIHGEWDIDVPLALAQDYFLHLTGAPTKRWIELGEATHMLVLEKNRRQAFDALAAFFDEV